MENQKLLVIFRFSAFLQQVESVLRKTKFRIYLIQDTRNNFETNFIYLASIYNLKSKTEKIMFKSYDSLLVRTGVISVL